MTNVIMVEFLQKEESSDHREKRESGEEQGYNTEPLKADSLLGDN